jgi:hypothetical protein
MNNILKKPGDEASIVEKIDWLKKINREHSDFFCSPDQDLLRGFYRSQHPTEICAFKCMDGRIHLPYITKTPLGIIQPFRNLAGKFDLGWPYLGQAFENWVKYSISKVRKCLVMVTYHFSAGNNEHRGCAGFDYDKQAALNFTAQFKAQIERVFGVEHSVVYPIIVGLETDTDSLIFHGAGDATLDLGKIDAKTDPEILRQQLAKLYPEMSATMINDLLPMVLGNLQHIAEIKASERAIIDSEHREFIIGIGRGFDWLHEPNIALLIGPYSLDLYQPVKTAMEIIQHNMEAGRIKNDGFIVLTSAPYYRSLGIDKFRAIEKTKVLTNLAKEVAAKRFPVLQPKMHIISAIVDNETREIEEV